MTLLLGLALVITVGLGLPLAAAAPALQDPPHPDPGGGPFGTIKGRAFIDANRNGQFDPVEYPVKGARITISGGGMETAYNTEADGSYYFAGLGRGKYDVTIVVGPEWHHTSPEVRRGVAVNGDVVSGIDFGIVRPGDGAPAPAAPPPAPRARTYVPPPAAAPAVRTYILPPPQPVGMPVTGITALDAGGWSAMLGVALLAIGSGGVLIDRRIRCLSAAICGRRRLGRHPMR
jgi:hypothetical protein